MRLQHPDLVPYVRGYGTAKDYLEALVTGRNADGSQRAHIRDTRTEWAEADGGAAAVDALFTRFDNGDLRLKDATNTLLTRTSHPNNQTDLNRTSPIEAALVEWSGTEPNDLELLRVKFWLNPRVNASQKREVVKWRLEILALSDFSKPAVGFTGHYVPIAEPLDVAVTGDAAGEVTFDYSSRAVRPQPKRLPIVAVTLFVITALNASGDAAGNVALGVNDAETSFSAGGQTLRRRRFSIATGGLDGGKWTDAGLALGVPHLVIENGTYTAATITFSSGNLFDLGGAPTGDVELVGLTATPPSTSVTLEVRNDTDTAWVTFTNGQFEEADLGFASPQSKKMRATLTPNVAGNLTPTLRRLGRQAIARIDFSRVATIDGYEQAFDPETHTTEIPRPRLVAVKDGPRDFATKIEKLLAENFINDIRIRWWVGVPALSRAKWTHMEDFLVLDSRPRQPVIELQLVGLSALLKDLAPPFSPGTNSAPDGTQSIGTWTDLVGGVTNIHLTIDEAVADETDGIRSVTSPANAEVIFTLPTPTDTAGRRLFVDTDYAKDASGGEQIDLKIRVYQTTTLVAELIKTDIGPDRVQSTMELTEAQIALLTDLPNVRLAFLAHTPAAGVGRRAQVYWARFRSGGKRETVSYPGASVPNPTLKAVYDDLLANRLSIPANLRGPGVENTTTTVSKQITGLRTRKPGSKDVVAKTELEAIAFLADMVVGSSEGRIKAFDLSPGQPIRALFRSRRIRIGDTSPGHERRIPEYFVPYRWDETKGEFKDEVRAFHTQSILKIGTVGLGPPKWLEEEIAKWIDSDALAEAVGKRTVDRLGTGTMLWSWNSSDRYPELEMGDVVAVETDQFVSRDPNVDIEIKGRRWAVGPLQRVGQGRFFTIHVRGYADILASVDAASRIMPEQVALTAVHQVWRGGNLFVHWVGSSKVRSVKVATSTTSQPAAGTGTAANGSTGKFDAGSSFAYANTVYITVTPYSDTGGAGVQGTAIELRVQLWQEPLIIDPINGKIFRAADYSEGGYALKASTTSGDTADAAVKESGGKPVNRLFAKPLAADPDTADSVTVGLLRDVVKLTALTSGEVDFSKAGVLNRVAANMLRAGGGATLQAIVANITDASHAAAAMQESGGKPVNRLLAKALAADPDSADSVLDGSTKRVTTLNEATGASRAFDVVDANREIGRVAPSDGNLIVNGDFERGVANWRVTLGGEMESTTTSPINGAKSLRITAVASTTHRIQQCDRTTDVNDSGDGAPLFSPVDLADEVFVEARVAASAARGGMTYTVGIEEYDTSKTLVQRTALATLTGDFVLGAILMRGGAALQASTRFFVPYLELGVGATDGGVVTRWDTVRCFVLPVHEHCKVYRSSNVSLTNGLETAVQWNAEDHDVGNPSPGMHSLTSQLEQITVKQGGYGKVELRGQVQFAAGATGYRRLKLRKNGTTVLAEVEVMAVTTASVPTTVQIGLTDRRPATNDYYEILATQTNGGILDIVAGIGASFVEAIHRPH